MPIPTFGAAIDPAQIQQQLAAMRQQLVPTDQPVARTVSGEMTNPDTVSRNKTPTFGPPLGEVERNPLLAAILGMTRAAAR